MVSECRCEFYVLGSIPSESQNVLSSFPLCLVGLGLAQCLALVSVGFSVEIVFDKELSLRASWLQKTRAVHQVFFRFEFRVTRKKT